MTVAELKKKLEGLDDNAKVLAEEKISGDEFDFEILMGTFVHNGNIVFWVR